MNENQTEPNHPPIEWGLFRAAREFGLHRATLAKRLAAAGEQPDGNGKYRTQQIVRAVFDADYHARLGLLRERRKAVEMENAATREEMASVAEVTEMSRRWAAAAHRAVDRMTLPAEAKEAILAAVDRMHGIDFSTLAVESKDAPAGGEW